MAHAWGGNILNVRQYKCLFKRILMTPTMSTVAYTKNANFRSRPYGRPFVPVDTNSVIHKLLVLLVLQY